jgi:hypothetical protein
MQFADLAFGDRDQRDAAEGEVLEEAAMCSWSRLSRSRLSATSTSKRPSRASSSSFW